MKQTFDTKLRLNKANKAQLETVNEIIEDYQEQGYKLTLRQLYYQLVSRDVIPNNVKEYAKLSNLLKKGRMAGVVDWGAIEDRIRVPKLPYWVYDIPDALNDTVQTYRLNRQKDQDYYIELWVEKDALSGVLQRKTSYYHINLMVNRGYSSVTAMYDAYKRIENACKPSIIFYLGDHDPSGLDMVRDIRDRLKDFGLTYFDPYILKKDIVKWSDPAFTIKHIGLTWDQIQQYNPPPNPAKLSDPRAKDYVNKYGNTSWEVDALNPSILHQLIDDEVLSVMNEDRFNEQIKKEEKDKKKLSKISEGFGE